MLSPQQDPPADKAPLLQGADEEEFEEEPLDRTALTVAAVWHFE
jgi:hypothetical protein